MAVCECASMMPGVTCLPRPSISKAPAGAETSRPTAVTFPSTTSTSAPSRMPEGPCVHTVAPRTTTAPGDASGPPSRAGAGRTSGAFAGAGDLAAADAASVFFGARSIRLPSIQISATVLFSSKGAPSRTTRFAMRPDSRVPRRSPRPSCRAGTTVTAASASSAESPRPIASRTRASKSSTFSRPSVVSEKVTPASRSHRGLPGARSNARRRVVETSSHSSSRSSLSG